MPSQKRYRCRLCGAELAAWLPVAQCPDTPRLLSHLGQRHPGQAGPYLDRMQTEDDIETILLAEVFEVVEAPEAPA
jgi:hypothetical protein